MILWIVIGVCGWLLLAGWTALLLNNPRRDPDTGLAMLAMRLYGRFVQRVRYAGLEHLPTTRDAGPLIIVSNHTAGVDPLLIQAVCPFETRFMMAADMMASRFDWLWKWAGVIPINRDQADMTALRIAIRHLKSGGVLGIFPEGRIVRESCRIDPFIPGLGLMVKKTGARVLPVTIQGTPSAPTAFASIWRLGRARVRFHEIIDYADTELAPAQIVTDLRSQMLEAHGWEDHDAA